MGNQRKHSLLGCIFLCAVLALLVASFVLPSLPHKCPYSERVESMQRGKAVYGAWASARNETGEPINAASIYDFAFLLSKNTELNDASVWIFDFDPNSADKIKNGARKPETVSKNLNGAYMFDENFRQFSISWEAANNIPLNAPASTPIFWTRGLNSDGHWDASKGVFGSKGGHIVFADGSVRWFEALRDDEHPKGLLRKYGADEPTFNISEAIPGGNASILGN